MSGLALMVMALLGVTIGNTDGGILDLLIFGVMQGMSTKWYLLFPVGIAWFAIYFFVFRWYILKHDIKTPGREVDAQGAQQAVEANTRAWKIEIRSRAYPARARWQREHRVARQLHHPLAPGREGDGAYRSAGAESGWRPVGGGAGCSQRSGDHRPAGAERQNRH
jgi:uncharacterized membrane protein